MQISRVVEKTVSGFKTIPAAMAAIVVSGACSLAWATTGLAAEEPLSDASRQEKAALIFTYLTGAMPDGSPQSIQDYLKSSELIDEFKYAAAELYGENDPKIVPWLYLTAMDRYRLAGILASDDERVSYHELRKLANEGGGKKLIAPNVGIDSYWTQPGSAYSVRVLRKTYMRDATRKFTEMAEIFENAGNPEAQAMARIYQADFQLLQDWGAPFANYRQAQELLRLAGIPEERIETFFGRAQLIPANRFHLTLDEAIENQEAELAARTQADNPARQAPYFAWDASVLTVRAPLPIESLNAARETYEPFDLRFRLSARGDVRAVNVVAATDSSEEQNENLVREAAYDLHFRPALENGRGQPQSGLHMRFHLPGEVK